MESNNLLNVVVDFKSGAYYAEKETNGEIKCITKAINGVDRSLYYKKNYSNRLIKKRRREIMEEYAFPKKLIRNVDTVLFKTLEDYDLSFSTDYKTRYLDAIKVGNYSKRRNKYLLRDLGMSIQYDVGLFGTSRKLSFTDRIRGIMKAFQQARLLGVKVDFSLFKAGFLQNQSEEITEQKHSWKKIDNKKAEKVIVEKSVEELKNEKENIALEKDGINEEKIIPMVPAKKKEEKRAIKIKNAKKEMRESKKYKNSYKLKDAQKEEKDSINLKQRRTEEYKAKHKAPVNMKARQKNENKEERKEKKNKEQLILDVSFSKGVRLIREIDGEEVSIRNKEYKRKNNAKKTLIAGFMGIAALAAVIAGGKIKNNNNSSSVKYRSEISTEMSKPDSYIRNITIEETREGEVVATVTERESSVEKSNIKETSSYKEMEETRVIDNSKIEENDNKELAESDNKIDEEAKVDIEEQQDYQDLVRVGARMNIQKGKFFETPEGTGKFGRFEKYADSKKIITIIGITTKDGYKSIKSNDISLKELKEKYPDAKFSFHFADEKGSSLGWLTSNSFEETIQNENSEINDGFDR